MHRFFQQQKALILRDIRTESGYALCERHTWSVDRVVLNALSEALHESSPDDYPTRMLPTGWSLPPELAGW